MFASRLCEFLVKTKILMHDLIISLPLMYLKLIKILKITSSVCDESNYMKNGYKQIVSL